MKELKDFINKKGQDIRRMIDSGASDYSSPDVDIVKNVLGVDTENDIILGGKYFHVRFLTKEDSVGLTTGIDRKAYEKTREFLIFITDADIKSAEAMTWEIYRSIATQFTKGGYVDAARRWAAAERLTVSVEDCENLAFCRWAFEQMECPRFLNLFGLTPIELTYMNTFINEDSCTNIVFLKKNMKWSTDTTLTNAKKAQPKANDQGLGSKHAKPSTPIVMKKDSEVSNYMNPMGLPLRSSFDECMALIIKNYGGSTPGQDIDVENERYVRISDNAMAEMRSWDETRWKKEHSRFVYFEKVAGTGKYINAKKDILPANYQELGIELLEKVILPKGKLIKERFDKYESYVKEYVIPHYNAYRQHTSVIDRNREEAIVKYLMRELIQNNKLTAADENKAHDSIIDRSVEHSINYLNKNGTYLSMNERLEMLRNGTLPPAFKASVPEWMVAEYQY